MDATIELLLAIGLILFVAIGTFAHRKSALRRDAAKLAEEERPVQPQVKAEDSQADILIKCVSCGRFQIEADEWFSVEDIGLQTEQSDVLAGVCPSCRVSPNG